MNPYDIQKDMWVKMKCWYNDSMWYGKVIHRGYNEGLRQVYVDILWTHSRVIFLDYYEDTIRKMECMSDDDKVNFL